MRFLVVGTNTRNVVESAKKAGYEVFALTKYVDADLKLYANKVFKIDEDFDKKEVEKRVKEMSESLNAKVILSSGYELLKVENFGSKINRKIVDKLKFYRELERIGIDYPEILSNGEVGILKPRIGGGGEGIRFSNKREKGHVLQRFIDGLPCSVSLLCSESYKAIAGVNEMIVGEKILNAKDFQYCGNITPLIAEKEVIERMIAIAKDLAEYFELRGSIGVDFILAEKPYVLEVNPRFQGSLDSIELSTDSNLFDLHVKAVENEKINDLKYKRIASRAILFAKSDLPIKVSPIGNPFYADIPNTGDFYKKDMPLVSVLATDTNIKILWRKILTRAENFLRMQGGT